MSNSWNRAHRRYQLVQDVLAEVARSGRPVVAPRLAAAVRAEFGDFGGLLRDVALRWYRAFDARLDTLLEQRPSDLPGAVADLWREVGEALPAARALLEAHAGHPALAELDEHHRRTLRAATGIDHRRLEKYTA